MERIVFLRISFSLIGILVSGMESTGFRDLCGVIVDLEEGASFAMSRR